MLKANPDRPLSRLPLRPLAIGCLGRRIGNKYINLFNNMSVHALALRQRAQSTVSLRRRIVRTNSEERRSDSELKKSSTMTSFRPRLERLIQEGKIEHLMNQDPSNKINLCYTNHVNDLEKELESSKKSLSTFVIKSKLKEQSVTQIKTNLKKVERETDILKLEGSSESKKHNFQSDDLEVKKNSYEILYWDEKVFARLKNRGYKDQVFLKGKYEALQRLHDMETDNRRLLENKYYELKQLNKELRGYKGKAQKIAREQTSDKNEFISLLERDMSERDLMGELKADKHRREGEINQIAPSLIEREELERILEVLNTHRVLSEIIKVKSNSLINRYEKVNKAYNYIKSNSNIADTDKILKRMEEHDKLYDDALKRVNALEAQLANLETGFDNMSISKNEILSQEGQAITLPSDYYQGRELDKYELLLSERQKLAQRRSEDEVLRLNMLEWGRRMFLRLGVVQSESNGFLECLSDVVVKMRHQR